LLAVFFVASAFTYESTFLPCSDELIRAGYGGTCSYYAEAQTDTLADLYTRLDLNAESTMPDGELLLEFPFDDKQEHKKPTPDMGQVYIMMWHMVFGDFGGYSELGDSPGERVVLFFVVTFFLPLIIANLFIALVSGESFGTVSDVRHLADWARQLGIIKEYELLMFWNKCTSNRQVIIIGQPGAESAPEVDYTKGLARSFDELDTRITAIDKGVSTKVEEVTTQL
jgi:hypothetical protein